MGISESARRNRGRFQCSPHDKSGRRAQSALSIVFYMAAASDLYKIHVNQINEGLGSFHRLFESTHAELGVAASQDAVQVVFSTVATAGRSSFCMRQIDTT